MARAHTTWFFEEFVLGRFASGYEPFHPAYRYLFNSYCQAVEPRHMRPEGGLLSRPGVAEIAAYRRAVDEAMLDRLPDPLEAEAAGLVELGRQHEHQHQELLLMDIKHVLSLNSLRPIYRPQRPPSVHAPHSLGWWEYDGGLIEIGHGGDRSAFDNETPRHVVHLWPFALASRRVTCGECLAFTPPVSRPLMRLCRKGGEVLPVPDGARGHGMTSPCPQVSPEHRYRKR